jgi:DNA-binding XRE family transcriptional regulator
MITPEQIRGARAMLNMKQADLAKAADISAAALHSIERGAATPRAATSASIQRALEKAARKRWAGVRFRKRKLATKGRR